MAKRRKATSRPQPHQKRGRRANVRPAKGFTVQMKGGPAAHKETVRRAKKAEEKAARRLKAWDYLLAGCTFKQIGQLCGVSDYTAWHDCMAYYEHLATHMPASLELKVAQQDGQLDALIRSHWAKKQEKASADIILRAQERRAKLFGLDRQRDGMFTADQVMGLVRGVTALFLEVVNDAELRRQFAVGLRRKLGSGLTGTIETPPRDEHADAGQRAIV